MPWMIKTGQDDQTDKIFTNIAIGRENYTWIST